MKILKCDICGYTQDPKNNSGDINIKDSKKRFLRDVSRSNKIRFLRLLF